MDHPNDSTSSHHYPLGGNMDARCTASACFRFLKRHINTVLIVIAIGLASAGSIMAWHVVMQQTEDRKVACANAEIRANSLRALVLYFSKDSPAEEQAVIEDYLDNNLQEVHCNSNGFLVPVGTNG